MAVHSAKAGAAGIKPASKISKRLIKCFKELILTLLSKLIFTFNSTVLWALDSYHNLLFYYLVALFVIQIPIIFNARLVGYNP
ncbi:hypothetical protein DCCM_4127 [Desulfocucumis palustris]|uniref:Uncharacterized protein n=1 Tax=Desulfocucumis palustris TaxID=1898651 RepID=A0A2L2XL33_9FIRM|nr:hypothetical protein DCCM_4127 [Desulfocucumis palustris]